MNKDLKSILNKLEKKGGSDGINITFDEKGIQAVKGKDGYSPIKGQDYFTAREIKEIIAIVKREATPVKGKDYWTNKELAEAIRAVSSSVKVPKDGKDGADGVDGQDGTTPDARAVAIDAVTLLESFDGDSRLSATALRDFEKALDIALKNPEFKIALTTDQIVGIKDLMPQYPPMNAGGSGATFLKSMRDVDLSSLTKNSDGKYILGGGGEVSDTVYGASWDGVTDEAASKNAIYDKIETLAGGHDAVTVTDTAEIDMTLVGQDIKADIKAGSIDETKLDVSVNASLDLADSAVQDSSTDTLINKTVDVQSNTIQNAGYLDMAKIGTPQYSNMMDIQATTHSTGLVAGGDITNNSDGTVTVTAGDGLLRATDSTLVTLYSVEWAEDTNVTLTDNSINYIYATYTSLVADPTIAVATSKPTDLNTNILLGTVYRSGVELHITTASSYIITNHISGIITRWQDTEYFKHASGAALSETGTRNIATTAGAFYEGFNKISTIAQDSSGASPTGHTFEYFYGNGAGGWTTHEESVTAKVFTGAGLDDATSGGTFVGSHTLDIRVTIDAIGTPDTFKWEYVGNDGTTWTTGATGVAITAGAVTLIDGITVTFAATTGHTVNDKWEFSGRLSTAIDNTQYDDGTGTLATLGNSKYGVHWIYVDTHGHLAVLFGYGSYSLTEATDAQPPISLPPEFETHVRLIGKVIVGKSDTVFTSIENNYGESFQGSVATDHGSLSGLGDDDHTQYLLIDGTRSMTGDLTVGSGATEGAVKSNGNHDLVLKTGNPTTGSITIEDGANGNIIIDPDGTGKAVVPTGGLQIDGGGHLFIDDNSGIESPNSDPYIIFDDVGVSAINYFRLSNALTSNAPSLSVAGTDTNIDLELTPKGSGVAKVGGVEVATLTDTQELTNKTLVDAKIIGAIFNLTGTAETLVIAHASGYVTMDNAAANTLTVPPNSSVAFSVGTRLMVQQKGAGATTIAAGAGVTINAPSTVTLAIGEQYESRGLLKTATDTWELI